MIGKEIVRRIVEAELQRDKNLALLTYLNTIYIGKIDECVGRLGRLAQKEIVVKNKKVTRFVNELRRISLKMVKLLRDNTTKKQVHVSTHGWLSYYERDYIKEGRLISHVQNLVKRRCGFYIRDMEYRIKTVAINQKNNFGSDITYETMLVVVWAKFMRASCDMIGEKIKRLPPRQRVELPTLMGNQAKAAESYAQKMMDLLFVEQEADCTSLIWRKMGESIDTCMDKIAGSVGEVEFSKKVVDCVTYDWVLYYLGRAVMDTQKNTLPAEVMAELLEIGAEKLVNSIAREYDYCDDPWDYMDALEEDHADELREIYEKVISRVLD